MDILNSRMSENENLPEQFSSEIREIKGIIYRNYSETSIEKAISWFPPNLKADEIILLPDLCPGRSPLPTGCCVIVNPEKQPDWRKFAISDVGCGIQVLKSNLAWEQFETEKWDELYKLLKNNKGKLGDLGSGNHFLDAAVDPDGSVFFVVHTGSRNESEKAANLVDKPRQFDLVYSQTSSWARKNRDTIAEMIKDLFGSLDLILDRSHNFYEDTGTTAIIRKGSVRLDPNQITIIPSNMIGDMLLVSGKETMAEIHGAMSHGTGRIKSRSELKKDLAKVDLEKYFLALRQKIYIPDEISNQSLSAEIPLGYRDIDQCYALIKKFVNVTTRLTPIAYLGQI